MPTIPGTIAATISDAELSALVLEEIVGWKLNVPFGYDTNPQGMVMCQAGRPSLATDANAVLKLVDGKPYSVEADPHRSLHERHVDFTVFDDDMRNPVTGRGPTLARSCCFALLKAKGWKVE